MSSDLVQHISDELDTVFKGVPRPIHLHEPELTGSEKDYVQDCIETGWVSSAGSYVDRFEAELSRYTGGYAVSTVNGTAALHLCLVLQDIGFGDEVLVPALTFIATANAVSYCGATPHFVDCERETLSIDVEKLEAYLAQHTDLIDQTCINKVTKKPIKALIVTHVFGHIGAMDRLIALCEKYHLKLIEDAAEALGSFYHERHAGLLGVCSALSFNGNKIITTGGGGAFLTKDKALAEKAKHLSTVAKVPDDYVPLHDEIGYNYRMPNINAALGCAQLERLESFLSQKRALGAIYQAVFQNIEGAEFMQEKPSSICNNWLFALTLPSCENRNHLINSLKEKEIFCRAFWHPLHLLPMYQHCPKMELDACENIASRSLNLPSSPALTQYYI